MDAEFLRVLLVDDDEQSVARIRRIMQAQRAPRFELMVTCDLRDTTAALGDPGCDVVLLNLSACGNAALAAYALITTHSPRVPVVVMAPAEQESLALRAVQHGASDYLITEQVYDTLLVRAIRHAIERQRAEEQQRLAQQALRVSEARYRALFEQSRDGILITDAELRIVEANRAAAQLLGQPPHGLAGRRIAELHEDLADGELMEQALRREGAASEIEVRLRSEDGAVVWCLLSVAERHDAGGKLLGYQGILHDITQRKRAEERLIHNAFHDPLTGLANRARFMDRLTAALARWRRRRDVGFAVLFIDLDRFKIVNDSLGHGVGDALLQHIAQALLLSMRDEDTVARLGGDEFAILVESVQEEGGAVSASERIQRRLAQSFEIQGHRLFASASIGIAMPDSPLQTAQDLLRNADIAMYRAKANGPGQHEVFTAAMHRKAVGLLQLETDLRHAVARGDFVVHYQPILELSRQRVLGFEALVRWQHPQRGLLMPQHFIRLAEETGLIVQLGAAVLRQACTAAAALMDGRAPQDVPFVAVNISARQIVLPALVQDVIAILAETGLPPHLLALEITEDTLVGNAAAAADNMNRLRHLGVRLCIDDFGTGYSSLSYLHALPISVLKIDRSFISQLEPDSDRLQVVETIVQLGRRLGMTIVAEGIETAAQLSQVEELGVDAVQGFLFSRPVDVAAAAALIGGLHGSAPPAPAAGLLEPNVQRRGPTGPAHRTEKR